MPNTRISDLTAAVSVSGTDVYPSVQTAGVGPVKTSLDQIKTYTLGGAGTLPVANGGTGLTSLTTGRIPFGNGTSAFGSSANLFWDGEGLGVGGGSGSPTLPSSIGRIVATSSSATDTSNRIGVAASDYLSAGGNTFTATFISQCGNSATGTQCNVSNAGLGSLYFQNTTAGLVYCNSGVPLIFGTSGAERMRIDGSTGNIGVATTSTRFKLSIGTTTGTITSTPDTIDVGATYSNSAGSNAKLRLFWDGSITYGFGVSASQLDYIVSGAFSHVFFTNGSEKLRLTGAGNLHTPAGSTGMTNGFLYMPAASGAPSGTPTAISGTVPFYYDTTGNQFYVYNGAWKKVALT